MYQIYGLPHRRVPELYSRDHSAHHPAPLYRYQYQDAPVYPFENGLYKLAAGWLIDKAGCRGITKDNAGTWEHQALVLVNRGGAKPSEIIALGKYICAKVKEKFAVDLYPEVRLIGKDGEVFWQDL